MKLPHRQIVVRACSRRNRRRLIHRKKRQRLKAIDPHGQRASFKQTQGGPGGLAARQPINNFFARVMENRPNRSTLTQFQFARNMNVTGLVKSERRLVCIPIVQLWRTRGRSARPSRARSWRSLAGADGRCPDIVPNIFPKVIPQPRTEQASWTTLRPPQRARRDILQPANEPGRDNPGTSRRYLRR